MNIHSGYSAMRCLRLTAQRVPSPQIRRKRLQPHYNRTLQKINGWKNFIYVVLTKKSPR